MINNRILGLLLPLFALLILEHWLFLHEKNNNYLNQNAFFLMLTSSVIGILYLYSVRLGANSNLIETEKANPKQRYLWVFWGLLSIVLCFEEIRKLFASFPADYNSDVLYVMEAQARRVWEGKPPFDVISVKNSYDVFPPYLPAFWLPMIAPMYMGIDPRWAQDR